MTKNYDWGNGTPKFQRIVSTNDSDYSWTVGTNKIVKILSVEVQLTTTATVGNRRLLLVAFNGSNVNMYHGTPSPAIAASKVAVCRYLPSASYSTQTLSQMSTPANDADVSMTDAIPELIMTASMYLRIYDTAAIDSAADDMVVAINYIEYDA